jgi:hypothetical protein
VAGCIAGAALAAAGATFLADGGAGEATTVFGTALRAIGRGLGNGTFAAASASTASADTPTPSAKAMPKAARFKALLRIGDSEANRVTALLLGESSNRGISSSSSLIMMPKHQMCMAQPCLRPHRGKIAADVASAGSFAAPSDPV